MKPYRHVRSALQKGFTLVELLIVVIILTIIAAIVIPQLSASTDDAKVAALDSNLARIRSAIDLYYQQHGHYPGNATAVGVCPGGGTTGTGTIVSAATRATAAAEQLTMFTNAAGQACTTTDSSFKYGPYLKTAGFGPSAMPKNPITDSNTITVQTTGNLNMSSASTTGGWLYDTTAGKFLADHSAYDDR